MSTKLEDRIAGMPEANTQAIEVKHSLCSKERLMVICDYAKKCLDVPGEYWEMGVYLGGSASLIGKIGRNKPLRLFDSFEGVSEPKEQDIPLQIGTHDDPPMWKGEWHGDMTRAILTVDRECIVHKGWIPETFVQVPDDVKVAFMHLDVDLYEPTKASLEFALPRLSDGGYIIVDDFMYPRHPGIEIAIREILPCWPNLKGVQEVYGQVVLHLDNQ